MVDILVVSVMQRLSPNPLYYSNNEILFHLILKSNWEGSLVYIKFNTVGYLGLDEAISLSFYEIGDPDSLGLAFACMEKVNRGHDNKHDDPFFQIEELSAAPGLFSIHAMIYHWCHLHIFGRFQHFRSVAHFNPHNYASGALYTVKAD